MCTLKERNWAEDNEFVDKGRMIAVAQVERDIKSIVMDLYRPLRWIKVKWPGQDVKNIFDIVHCDGAFRERLRGQIRI